MTSTAASAQYPLPRERNLILGSLLALAGASWAVLAWQGAGMDEMSLTMGMSAPLFIALWIVMMVAIMFPTAAPMILMFARISSSKRERGQAFVPTWVFTASYLLVWSATGIGAYAIAVAGDAIADESAWVMDNAPRLGGALLVAAGLYQLTPLKDICLSKCRTPIGFVLGSWRDGYDGAFRMGVEHGVYCFGCCWLLFLIPFPLGMMNVIVLAVITALIFAEKSLPIGRHAARAAALALVLFGAIVIFEPGALPMTMDGDAMEMGSPAEMGTDAGEMSDTGMAPLDSDQTQMDSMSD